MNRVVVVLPLTPVTADDRDPAVPAVGEDHVDDRLADRPGRARRRAPGASAGRGRR